MMKITVKMILLMSFFSFLSSCMLRYDENYYFRKISEFEDELPGGKLYMVDGDTGLLFYYSDDASSPTKSNTFLYKITDGGNTVKRIEVGEGQYDDLTCSPDGRVLSLTVSLNREDAMMAGFGLYLSTDFGDSWEYVHFFKDQRIGKIFFVDRKVGFAKIMEEPIGYEDGFMLKTEDGGKTWKRMKGDFQDLSFECITKDGRLLGSDITNENEIWEVDMVSWKMKKTKLKIDDHLKIYGLMITDPITQKHYVNVLDRDYYSAKKEWIYCLETEEMTEVPHPSYGINVYGGDYISTRGASQSNSFMSRFNYSTDGGKTWHQEVPLCHMVGEYALYGRGLFWSVAVYGDKMSWPLMVRIPTEKERQPEEKQKNQECQ